MTLAPPIEAPALARLRPEPWPVTPYGPYRLLADGRLERFETEGPKVIRFIETYCVFTNGKWIRQPFKLLPWEKQLLLDGFELVWCERHNRLCRKYRTWLVGVGKKQGKTELVSGIALYFLLGDGEPAPLVPCAAAGDDQADLIFNAVKTMCELSPRLADLVQVWDKQITVPEKPNAEIRRVPASGGRLDGKNIYCPLCDELHEWVTDQQRKTWGMMRGGMAAREHPVNINITTAGEDQSNLPPEQQSICYRLYQYGRRMEAGEVQDPTFFFRWWEAAEDWDWRDLSGLLAANPSYGVTVQEDFYRDEMTKRSEYEFRRYYGNQFTAASESWLPYGSWEQLVHTDGLVIGAPTWAAWDQSTRRDSTAILVGQWVDDDGVRKIRIRSYIWERDIDGEGRPREDWKIPQGEVLGIIRRLGQGFEVRDIGYDPWGLTLLADELENEGLPMVEFPQTDARMVPATEAAFELVQQGRVQHDGEPRLARHIKSARPKEAYRGGKRLTKSKDGAYNDGAIALVMLIGMMMSATNEEEGAPMAYVFGGTE